MNRLGWYWSRARAMSAPEVAWRVGRLASETAAPVLRRARRPRDVDGEHWAGGFAAFRAAIGRPVLLDRARAADLARRFPAEAATVVAAADECRAGRFAFFGQEPVELGPGPIDWRVDPRTGFRWPDVPAARLDHRTVGADPKWIWELNRLQHLPWLAQAWLFTDDRAYADAALDHLDGWLEQNPVGQGIAWRGAFEVGVRALSVAVALQGLRDAPSLTRERYARVVAMLGECAPLLWRQRSRFSSANNHLVGEMAGLAAIAILHPEVPGARRWEEKALSVLAREAGRQILPDGSGAEQAVVYQLFCSDLLLVPAALVRLRGNQAPPPVLDALRRGAHYLRTLLGDGDPLPRYGDDDGGIALRLLPDPVPDVHRHLAATAAVLGGQSADLAAAWLGGPGESGAAPTAASRELYAADGGLVVMRRGDRRVTVDVGPLGYLSIAAHGHADALSVTLSASGHDLIGDPGTGSYYAEPAWRRAFRGTRAHATVAVDDADQSVSGGPFLWVRHAGTTVRAVDLERGIVEAEHDGYTRLDAPVVHRRYVVAPREQDSVLVVDVLTGEGEHRVRTAWPLHPELELRTGGDTHFATRDGRPVLQIATAAGAPWSLRGDEETRLGWWSPRFEAWEPAWLVGTVLDAVRLPVVVATVLTVSERAEPVVDGLAVGGTDVVEVTWTERAGDARVPRSVTLDTRVAGAVTVRAPAAR